jgi:hypothetical protein
VDEAIRVVTALAAEHAGHTEDPQAAENAEGVSQEP